MAKKHGEMNKEKLVVEILGLDMSGYRTYDKTELMLLNKKFLKPKKNNRKGELFTLTEEGIKHLNGKKLCDPFLPEHTEYYDIRILSKDGLFERIKTLEQKIEQEEDELALLKLAKELNF